MIFRQALHCALEPAALSGTADFRPHPLHVTVIGIHVAPPLSRGEAIFADFSAGFKVEDQGLRNQRFNTSRFYGF
jgi:hypothetical protein